MATPFERVLPAAVPGAGGRIIATPFQFLSTGEDDLLIEAWNSASGVTVGVDGRWIQQGRNIDAFAHRLICASDRTRTAIAVKLGVGYVLNLTVYAASGAPRVGQTFVRVSLIRGLGAAAIVLGTLLQGYVTARQGLGWPGSPIESSIEGGGYVRTISGTQPGAGADFSETVPTGARWELLRVYNFLVAAVGGVNRAVYLEPIGNANLTAATMPAATQAAATTGNYTWGQNLPTLADAANAFYQSSVPAVCILNAADSFRAATFNLAAGDQWNIPRYVVREWLEVDA